MPWAPSFLCGKINEGTHQAGVSYNDGVSTSTGSERAIEIHNPTTNLNPYLVRRYSNGLTAFTENRSYFATLPTN